MATVLVGMALGLQFMNSRLLRCFLKLIRDGILLVCIPIFIPMIFIAARRKGEGKLVWGHTPIINNKYWSLAMRQAGYQSLTLMETCYNRINEREDFDLYFEDVYSQLPCFFHKALEPWLILLYLARHAAILHMPFYGGAFRNTRLWRIEAFLYRISSVKTIVIPYGGDMYMYSRIFDPGIRHALLLSYPMAAKNEKAVSLRVDYWTKHADVILMGYTLEGIARWDVPCGNMLAIDVDSWEPKRTYSNADGVNGVVRILHNPNHTGVKGSEFIQNAVKTLQERGLKIELAILQGVKNKEVRDFMRDVDIHADQLILPGYGMAAVEAMATGLPVIANLSDKRYTQIFRRYSFLDECPIFSSTPETIIDDLELLVCSPELRTNLGKASRLYVEKYHSLETSQYLFGSIYKKILHHHDVDLMNLFHPLKSEFSSHKPRVEHPLVDNKLPSDATLR